MRALVIDGDPGREQLIRRIEQRTSFEAIGESPGPAVLSQIAELAPDVAIIGELEGGTRAIKELTSRIRAVRPDIYILVVDDEAVRASIPALLEAGISGLISRDQPDWFLHRISPLGWRADH